MKKFLRIVLTLIVLIMALAASGCNNDATVASRNLSKAADMFEVNRRVVFYNGITGEYILSVEGLCSIKADRAVPILLSTPAAKRFVSVEPMLGPVDMPARAYMETIGLPTRRDPLPLLAMGGE
jgi:uncharacterized protein YceK